MKPRALLILCEGTTERLYFESVIQHRRVSRVLDVQVFGKQGQHKALIKKCSSLRKATAKELKLSEDEIEVWAVCDRDVIKITYRVLQTFANAKNVKLAFSDPQFETYLIQHFEFKKTKNKRATLITELEAYLSDKYDKGDLSWIDKLIDEDPARLDFAITNADKLKNHAKPPFLTVQKLTKRLLEFAK